MSGKRRLKKWIDKLFGKKQSLALKGEPVFLYSTLPTIYLDQPSDAIESATRKAQTLLQEQNIPCEVTGKFDEATMQAVRTFQIQRKLVVDGVVGSLTWSALLYPKLSRSNAALSPETQHRVEQLQAFLAEEGFPSRDRSGYFGKDTEKALKAFQRKYGLQADGIADEMTMAVLSGVLQRPEERNRLQNSFRMLWGIYSPPSILAARLEEITIVTCTAIGMQFEFRGQSTVQLGFGFSTWVYAIAISWLVPRLLEHFFPNQRHSSNSLLDLYGPYFLIGALWRQVLNALFGLISSH